MKKLFGTDGIRGLANEYPVNAELAFNLGEIIGYLIKNEDNKNILIGKDTRISGDMLEAALTAGICSSGGNVLNVGITTTPAIGFLTKHFNAKMGIAISASHNPYHDNGIKLFQGNGLKINEETENKIERMILKEKYKKINSTGKRIGRAKFISEAKEIYTDFIISTIPKDFKRPEYRIIIDCANGSASSIVPDLLTRLKMDFKIINDTPNGININHKCGSTHIYDLQKKIVKGNFDLGIAFDGDADRVLAVDEKGIIVNGDQIMTICASTFIEEGKLGNNLIVTTHMSNLGFDKTIESIGGSVIRTDIGDKNVLEEMIRINSFLGGEQSGHIIILPFNPNGDGIINTFQFLHALNKKDCPVSVQAAQMIKYHQELINYEIKDKVDLFKDKYFQKMYNKIENYLGKDGRVFIRLSGTEKKIRVLLESKSDSKIKVSKKYINEYFLKKDN